MAMRASTPTITTTIISSTRVKPAARRSVGAVFMCVVIAASFADQFAPGDPADRPAGALVVRCPVVDLLVRVAVAGRLAAVGCCDGHVDVAVAVVARGRGHRAPAAI